MTAGLRWSKMFPFDMANFQFCAGYVNDLGLDPNTLTTRVIYQQLLVFQNALQWLAVAIHNYTYKSL